MIKLFLLGIILLFGMQACADSPQYTREQCIVRVNIDWREISPDEKESSIRLITKLINEAPLMGYGVDPGGSTIQGENREFIFYQYRSDCEARHSNMERTLTYVRANANLDALPLLSVDPRKFKPGVNTIRSSGKWWSDQDKPAGKRVVIDGKEYMKVE